MNFNVGDVVYLSAPLAYHIGEGFKEGDRFEVLKSSEYRGKYTIHAKPIAGNRSHYMYSSNFRIVTPLRTKEFKGDDYVSYWG